MKWTEAETSAWFEDRCRILEITQAEFAHRVGITAADLSRYKSRKQEPRVAAIEKIAQVSGFSIVDVMIAMGFIDPSASTTPKTPHDKRFLMLKRNLGK